MKSLGRTKPISSSLTEPRRPDCAKQSQTWVGWDTWRVARAREADRAKQSQEAVVGSRWVVARTNPIWRANRAKRSQSHDCGLRISDCGLETDLPGFGLPLPIVRNEPNSWIADCGFRIVDWVQADGKATDRAEQTQFPWSANGSGGQNAQNEPNLGRSLSFGA